MSLPTRTFNPAEIRVVRKESKAVDGRRSRSGSETDLSITQILFRLYRTVLKFGSTFNLDRGAFSFNPKRDISLTIFGPRVRSYTRQVKPLFVYIQEGDIDLIVKLYYENFSIIARVGNSRFECFIVGAPKSCGEYQNE